MFEQSYAVACYEIQYRTCVTFVISPYLLLRDVCILVLHIMLQNHINVHGNPFQFT